MTGTLRIKNGIYQMRFSWKDSEGKWHRKEESTGLPEKGNKRAANEMLANRLTELKALQKAGSPVVSPLFLSEMEKWLDNVLAHEIRENTLHQYRAVFHKHILPYEPFKHLKLSDISPKLLQDYINLKISSGLSPETVRKHLANLHKFLEYATRLEIIPYNPADRVTLPKKNRRQRGSTFTAEQVHRLFTLFQGDPIELAVYITATYGLRRSEICGLKWDAVDLEHGYFTVQHTAIVDCGHVIYSDRTKTASSFRRLPLTQPLKERLTAALHKQEEQKAGLCSAYHDGNFVCCWPDGSPILPEYLSRHYREMLSKSDLPFIQFRNLRDTCATLLHQNGFDVKDIQGWLGHADPDTTARVYVHFQDANLSKMAQSMEQTLNIS